MIPTSSEMTVAPMSDDIIPEEKHRITRIKIADPASLYESWAYTIPRCFYTAFGTEWSEYKVRKLRKDGSPPENEHPLEAKARALKHSRYASWSTTRKTLHDFHEGDIFYSKSDSASFLQVKGIHENMIHVAEGIMGQPSTSYHDITPDTLLSWLKNGRTSPRKNANRELF